MKKLTGMLLPLQVMLQLAYPACLTAALIADLVFRTRRKDLFVGLCLTMMVLTTLLLWIGKIPKTRTCKVCCLLLLPISILNGTLWVLSGTVAAYILGAMNMVCGVLLLWRCGSRYRWKFLSAVIAGVTAMVCAGLCCMMMLVDAVMPSVTVIDRYPSPDGAYTAQVVVTDGGARGANTQVELYDHSRDVELLIGKLMLQEKVIYSGPWKEYETMTVRWGDDHTLLIDEEVCYEGE